MSEQKFPFYFSTGTGRTYKVTSFSGENNIEMIAVNRISDYDLLGKFYTDTEEEILSYIKDFEIFYDYPRESIDYKAVPDVKSPKISVVERLEDYWFNPDTPSKFQKLQDELGQWADETFGPRTPVSLLHHLKEEVGELMDALHDESEWADCLTLLIDSYRLQTGKNTDQLLDACFEKLEINKQRTWGDPDENGIVRHVKE